MGLLYFEKNRNDAWVLELELGAALSAAPRSFCVLLPRWLVMNVVRQGQGRGGRTVWETPREAGAAPPHPPGPARRGVQDARRPAPARSGSCAPQAIAAVRTVTERQGSPE